MSVVRIAHLSDSHFGTILDGVEQALTAKLHELKPDFVLLSGDITQRARRPQFEAAKRFKDGLAPIPSFAIPGNHDIPLYNVFGRLLQPYRGFHKYFQSKHETDFALKKVRVLGLNSTSRWRLVQGSLNLPRIESRVLNDWTESQVRLVSVHHPLDCAKRIDDKNLMTNREEVFGLFERAEIDMVLSGHVHDPYVGLSTARYPNHRRAMILSVAGTCTSSRTRKGAPNSFHWIEVETETEKRISITRFDMDDQNHFNPRLDCLSRFIRDPETGWRPV